ncbi:hypothetical protein ACFE04_001575 [Oxalis oulophora]
MAETKEPQQREPTLPSKRKPDSDTQLQPPIKTQKVVDPTTTTTTTTTDPDVKNDDNDMGGVVVEEEKKKVDRKGKGIMIVDEEAAEEEDMSRNEEELVEMRDRKGKGIMKEIARKTLVSYFMEMCYLSIFCHQFEHTDVDGSNYGLDHPCEAFDNVNVRVSAPRLVSFSYSCEVTYALCIDASASLQSVHLDLYPPDPMYHR